MMGFLKWLAIGLGAIFAILVFFAAIAPSSPEIDSAHAVIDQVNRDCDRMMSDAALGDERRTTRQMCDQLKATAQKRLDDAIRAARNK